MHVVLIVALTLAFGFASFVSGAEYSLFTGDLNSILQSNANSPSLLSNQPQARQWRQISLNPVIASQNVLSEKDILNLSLFAGTTYSAYIDNISTNIKGTITIRGRIDGFPLSYMLISTTGNRSLGSICIPEKNEFYIIQNEPGNRTHYLLNVDPNQLDKLKDEPSPVAPLSSTRQPSEFELFTNTLANNPLDTVTIDVMIVYTPAARAWADTYGGGISNIIAQAVAKGQLVLDNSNTYVTLNNVYSGEISYTESDDAETDLNRLTYTSDDYMNDVHTLRNQYNADVVGLLTYSSTYTGIGWLMPDNADFAFSITNVQVASWSYTYIHEIGHNMGCGHHKDQYTQPGSGWFNYSAGWRWIGTDSGKYCSVMCYESGDEYPDGQTHTRVPYFSNPNILYKGVATGNSDDGDNARTIRETKFAISDYLSGGSSSTFIDIGLRYYDGTKIVKIACEQGTPTSPLRISKNGTTYGLALVDRDDPYATGIIIQTSSGPKAIRKL